MLEDEVDMDRDWEDKRCLDWKDLASVVVEKENDGGGRDDDRYEQI